MLSSHPLLEVKKHPPIHIWITAEISSNKGSLTDWLMYSIPHSLLALKNLDLSSFKWLTSSECETHHTKTHSQVTIQIWLRFQQHYFPSTYRIASQYGTSQYNRNMLYNLRRHVCESSQPHMCVSSHNTDSFNKLESHMVCHLNQTLAPKHLDFATWSS